MPISENVASAAERKVADKVSARNLKESAPVEESAVAHASRFRRLALAETLLNPQAEASRKLFGNGGRNLAPSQEPVALVSPRGCYTSRQLASSFQLEDTVTFSPKLPPKVNEMVPQLDMSGAAFRRYQTDMFCSSRAVLSKTQPAPSAATMQRTFGFRASPTVFGQRNNAHAAASAASVAAARPAGHSDLFRKVDGDRVQPYSARGFLRRRTDLHVGVKTDGASPLC